VPGSHFSHSNCPALAVYSPDSHEVHADNAFRPAAAEYLPAGQSVQVWAAALYLPASHSLQMPPFSPIDPALHAQDVDHMDPCGDELSAGQSEHALNTSNS